MQNILIRKLLGMEEHQKYIDGLDMSYVKLSTPMMGKHTVKISKVGEQQEDHQTVWMSKLDITQTFPYLLTSHRMAMDREQWIFPWSQGIIQAYAAMIMMMMYVCITMLPHEASI